MKFLMFAFLLSISSASLAQDFQNSSWLANGQSIKNASQYAIDAKGDFYRILTYQDMYDKPLTFFGVNYRSAPGSFLLDDGSIVEDNLNRILITMGLRLGNRAFIGVVADAIENGKLGESGSQNFSTNVSQGLVYGGYKFGPVQASVAWQNSPGQSGLNIRNEFVNLMSGAPDLRIVEQPYQNKMIYSIYAKPGVYVSYSEFSLRTLNPISNETMEGPKQSELQVIIQSPKRYLPEWAGLPFLAIDRFTNVQFLDESSSESETVFGTIGSDDIHALKILEGLGIRLAAQYKLKPTMAFRNVEASGKWKINEYIEVGMRTFVFHNSGSPSLASDEYISFGWKNKARWAFVHSYNSPDRSTFLPISGIHVYGFQVVYGISDIIKPLIPMIRSLSDDDR